MYTIVCTLLYVHYLPLNMRSINWYVPVVTVFSSVAYFSHFPIRTLVLKVLYMYA